MASGWQKITITQKNISVIEAEKGLLNATKKWIASNGARSEAAEVSSFAALFVNELLTTASKRKSWMRRLLDRLRKE